MRKWTIVVLVVLAFGSLGRVRRDITGRTMQEVRTAARAEEAADGLVLLEARVMALEARVRHLEGKAVVAPAQAIKVPQKQPDGQEQAQPPKRIPVWKMRLQQQREQRIRQEAAQKLYQKQQEKKRLERAMKQQQRNRERRDRHKRR